MIITAHGHPNLIDQAVQEGVIHYLLKPVTSPSLHAAIQVALARSQEIKTLRDNVSALELTLRERKLIERAKGILMTRRNMSEPEAFRFLQRQSQDRRMPMAKLAESIVQADELLESTPNPGYGSGGGSSPSGPSGHGPLHSARTQHNPGRRNEKPFDRPAGRRQPGRLRVGATDLEGPGRLKPAWIPGVRRRPPPGPDRLSRSRPPLQSLLGRTNTGRFRTRRPLGGLA